MADFQFWAGVIAVPVLLWICKELLRLLKEIRDQIIQLNLNLAKQEQRLIELDRKVEDHETRLRQLE